MLVGEPAGILALEFHQARHHGADGSLSLSRVRVQAALLGLQRIGRGDDPLLAGGLERETADA